MLVFSFYSSFLARDFSSFEIALRLCAKLSYLINLVILFDGNDNCNFWFFLLLLRILLRAIKAKKEQKLRNNGIRISGIFEVLWRF